MRISSTTVLVGVASLAMTVPAVSTAQQPPTTVNSAAGAALGSAAPLTPATAAVANRSGGGLGTRGMAAAQRWAMRPRATAARWCRSGNDFRRANGSGRYGAYQLTKSQWRQLGGREFAGRPDLASKREQNLVGWRLRRADGWKALKCPTSNWMRNVYLSAPKSPLGAMIIPGTHDSGSSEIDTRPPCKIRAIAGAPAFIDPAIQANPCGVGKLARAQNKDLGDQLRDGNRYLDIRVAVPADKVLKPTGKPIPPATDPLQVPLVLHHNVVSQPLKRGLRQVLRFAAKHPREQIILDFQHVDLTGDKQVDRYYIRALDKLLRSYAPGTRTVCRSAWTRGKIPRADRNLAAVPINRAWRANRNLLVLFPDGVMPDRSCYRSRDKALISLWPNTEDPAVSSKLNANWLKQREAKLSGQSACRDADGNWCGLYVSQLQLTAQIGTQANCIFGAPTSKCSLRHYSQLVNNDIADKIKRWRLRQGLPMNIVMTDFSNVSDPDVSDTSITANWKLVNRWTN